MESCCSRLTAEKKLPWPVNRGLLSCREPFLWHNSGATSHLMLSLKVLRTPRWQSSIRFSPGSNKKHVMIYSYSRPTCSHGLIIRSSAACSAWTYNLQFKFNEFHSENKILYFVILYYINSFFQKHTHIKNSSLDKLESLKELECLTVRQGVKTGFIFMDNSKCWLTVLFLLCIINFVYIFKTTVSNFSEYFLMHFFPPKNVTNAYNVLEIC